ncbi:uncharacterized protein BDR25DRAFT_179760, partial [Lindgomyces ingoldianus]
DRNLGWNIEYATAFLVNHLDEANSPDVADTLKKVRIFAERITKEGHSRDVAYRVFNKLDEILFAGHLKDAVFLGIRSIQRDVSGVTFNPGQSPNKRVHRISIILNADLHQYASSKFIIASLIHHMIHAYFLVACGPQEEKEVDYGRLAHGVHFGKIMHTIKNLSGAKARPLPLGFGHPLPRGLYDNYHTRHRFTSKWFCTHCYSDIDPILETEVDDWYKTYCLPTLELPESAQKSTILIYNPKSKDADNLEEIPRAQTTPSADAVEFVFDEKCIQIPRDKIDAYSSIRRAFNASRFLAIPEDVQRETFMALLELLYTGSYSPDIVPVTTPGRKGPPVIKPPHRDSQPFLLTDIRIFKLANALAFDDVKGIAIQRLKAQCITREDPITVLREIYDGCGEPDPSLRSWARKFLAQRPGRGSDGWDGMGVGIGFATASGAGGGRPEAPNLIKLEREMVFRDRFLNLIDQSGAAHIDVLKVREALGGLG